MKYFQIVFIVMVQLLAISLQAQSTHHETNESHGLKGTNRITVGLGHTHVSEGIVEGKTQWLPLASWSLNYDYWLSDRWAIGLQNDWILESFKVEEHGGEIIERTNPIAVVPVGMYKFKNGLTTIAGAGIEFSKGHNLGLTRLGFEYGWHLPKNFELGVALVWDNKWNYYNSWGLAVTVSKLWGR
jgi:hypothetical protein